MAITQGLLSKTLRWYVLYAIVIVLVTGPIFYFVTRHLYIEEANETLKLHKKEFLHNDLPNLKLADIDEWNRNNRDQKIEARKSKHRKDKFSTAFFYDKLSNEHEPYRVIVSPITIEGKTFSYVAKINLVEREDLIKSIALLFLGLIVALLIGLYFITRIISLKIWKPFYNALDHLENFEIDKSAELNLSTTNINEFVRLNQAIEGLIHKNTTIYNNQREFIENAAHELQTPVAVIQGKLEALIQQTNLTQAQSEALEKLNESVSRLARLNKNLLLLSRIDRNQFSDWEDTSINELLKKHFEFFSEQSASKQIKVDLNASQPLVIRANSTLTEIFLNNLLFNAIKHNISGGSVSIALTNKNLSITNTGIGRALPQEKIFDRFSKIDPSTHGSGLGLAIVKKIADLNQWKIQYTFQNNFHTFSVDF